MNRFTVDYDQLLCLECCTFRFTPYLTQNPLRPYFQMVAVSSAAASTSWRTQPVPIVKSNYINVHMPSCKVPVAFVRLQANLNLVDRLQYNPQLKISRNPDTGTTLAFGRTARHDEANRHFSQLFCRLRLKITFRKNSEQIKFEECVLPQGSGFS